MNKKLITQILYIAAIVLMGIGLYIQLTSDVKTPHITFWLGLLTYAFGALMKQREKREEMEEEGTSNLK